MAFKKWNCKVKHQYLLHELKYKSNQEIGIFLGKLIGGELAEISRKFDCIIPVPLHPKKLFKRGYNQSELLANGIRKILSTDLVINNLERILFTETQTKKSKNERIKNMKGAFAVVNKKALENKKVLLIDDVFTTGATLAECINELNKVKGIEVSIAVLARTNF